MSVSAPGRRACRAPGRSTRTWCTKAHARTGTGRPGPCSTLRNQRDGTWVDKTGFDHLFSPAMLWRVAPVGDAVRVALGWVWVEPHVAKCGEVGGRPVPRLRRTAGLINGMLSLLEWLLGETGARETETEKGGEERGERREDRGQRGQRGQRTEKTENREPRGRQPWIHAARRRQTTCAERPAGALSPIRVAATASPPPSPGYLLDRQAPKR